MKSSVKKFLAVALVGGALFGATGAQAHDRGDNRFDHGRYDKKVVHVYKHKPQRQAYRHYDARPKYVYRDHYQQRPGRLIIGFNF